MRWTNFAPPPPALWYVQTRTIRPSSHTKQNRIILDFKYFFTNMTPSLVSCALPALPHDVLEKDFYVPGTSSRLEFYKSKSPMLADALTLTTETAMYFQRATQDRLLANKWSTIFIFSGPMELNQEQPTYSSSCAARTFAGEFPKSPLAKPRRFGQWWWFKKSAFIWSDNMISSFHRIIM